MRKTGDRLFYIFNIFKHSRAATAASMILIATAPRPSFGSNQAKIPEVAVRKITPAPLFDRLSYPARIVSRVQASVVAEFDGMVTRIRTPLGEQVKRGQALLLLEHTDPVYQYAPVSLKAPVAGVISALEVTEGSRVSKGQKLLTLTDPAKVRILVEVAAVDLPSLRHGLSGDLRLAGQENTLPARITGLSPLVDPATGTATCELSLMPKPDSKGTAVKLPLLIPGMLGQVSFRVNEHQGISVPESVVIYKDQGTFIRLVQDGKAKRVPVTLGKIQRGQVEILKGLSENDVIVERASSFIADGEAVQIQKNEKL